MKFLILLASFSLQAVAGTGEFNLFIKGTVARSSWEPRDIYVYLPPGYDESGATRYPVLYMHDGQNLFDPTRANFGVTWQVPETLNRLIKEKRIPPIIVVAVDSTKDRTMEYTHAVEASENTGGRGQIYMEYLAYDLKRYIDHVLPTNPSPEHTGLMGSSHGGLISAYGGARFPEAFGLIGSLSPSVWWSNSSILSIVRSAKAPQRAYVDAGTIDGETPKDAQRLARAYKAAGTARVKLIIQRGGIHHESSWAQRLPGALEFLFGED